MIDGQRGWWCGLGVWVVRVFAPLFVVCQLPVAVNDSWVS
jgi:hypothetical protein